MTEEARKSAANSSSSKVKTMKRRLLCGRSECFVCGTVGDGCKVVVNVGETCGQEYVDGW